MWRATLKGVLAHKFRLVSTFVAVLLGVSFVAGTFVLSDTIRRTFDTLFADGFQGVDVTVRSESAFEVEHDHNASEEDREPVDASLLETVKDVDGVAEAEGSVGGYAQIVDKKGEAISPQGPPTLGVGIGASDELSPLRFTDGERPTEPDHVAIDRATAETYDFAVGDRVKILFKGPAREFTISGIFRFGEADNLAGATLAGFTTETAQEVVGQPGRFDSIEVVAEDGVDSDELRRRILAAIPERYEAVSGDTVAEENANSVKEGLSFFTTFLLVFAGIALFVGTFIIFNTFSIIVAQRIRELALLRALGASRRQVMRSVLTEAMLVGFLASLAGIVAGVGVAIGLTALLRALEIDIPSGPVVLKTRTVIVSIVVGVLVTTVASFLPARKAGRIAPVAALRDTAVEPAHSLRRRLVSGGIVLAIGVVLLGVGLFADVKDAISLVGLGCMILFLGVSMLAPVVARPLARGIGAPLPRAFGVPGRLARENAMRNPRRTASTASALIIGLGLVGAVAVLAASIKVSVKEVVEEQLAADYVLVSEGFGGFSPTLAAQLREVDEIDAVSPFRLGRIEIDGDQKDVQGVDPSTIGRVLKVEMVEGSLDALTDDALLISEQVAEDEGWPPGEELDVRFARTGDRALRVGGVFERNEFLGNFIVSIPLLEANVTDPLDFAVLLRSAEGASDAEVAAAVKRVTDGFPNVKVRTNAEYLDFMNDQLNQLLGLVYALLLLAIVIALIGIMNTMALSVFERTRELGLVRAIGMSRRQLRRMIRWESVVVSVLGAVVGLVVGVGFGIAMATSLRDQGIRSFAVPVPTIAIVVLLAGVAGMLAAILPARRASRLNVLEAIAAE